MKLAGGWGGWIWSSGKISHENQVLQRWGSGGGGGCCQNQTDEVYFENKVHQKQKQQKKKKERKRRHYAPHAHERTGPEARVRGFCPPGPPVISSPEWLFNVSLQGGPKLQAVVSHIEAIRYSLAIWAMRKWHFCPAQICAWFHANAFGPPCESCRFSL